MLKEFSFKNCRSFKDESVLSMEADYALKDHLDFVVPQNVGNDTIYINPVVAIYGCNAGGKTNMLRALSDARSNIYVGLALKNTPYVSSDSTFMHKLTVVCDGAEYEYEYRATNAGVLEESLHVRKPSKKDGRNLIYHRVGDKIEKTIYKKDSTEKAFLDIMANNMGSLVMKMAGQVGLPDFEPFYKWCGDAHIDMRDLGEKNRHELLNQQATILHKKEKSGELSDFSQFIANFDPSIRNLYTFEDGAPKKNKKSDDLEANKDAKFVIVRNNGSRDVGFLVENESNGTKKLMELYPSIKNALQEGTLFVCDEMDALLHPLVFKKIVSMFNSKESNPKGAQLIFAAHNTIVLNRECLRRDQIYFVEKDEKGTSSVFRLSDVVDGDGNKVRMDARYDRLYLAGFFGALPDRFAEASVQVK